MFFPVVAAAAFRSIPDTHLAGMVVRSCLVTLHYEGILAGALIVILLIIAQTAGATQRRVIAPAIVTILMLALTCFSQFWIIPRMEGYRIAAGGAIDKVASDDPNRIAFDRLHVVSKESKRACCSAASCWWSCWREYIVCRERRT